MGNAPYLLDGIVDLIVTTLYTAVVTDAVPVSLLLVADSGTAKSKLLKSVKGPCLHHTDSFSSQGLFQLMQNDRDGLLRWIITVDLNPTLSRPSRTVNATVANLLTLTMDGTCRIDDGREEKILEHRPIGFLSAVTPEMYQKQVKKFFQLGLTRRIVPVFYEYSVETIEKLKAIVRDGQITGEDFPLQKINLTKEHKPAISTTRGMQIDVLAQQFSTNLGLTRMKDSDQKLRWYLRKIIPISPTVTLRTLAQAYAIRHGRGQVDEPEIEFLTKFIGFTNPSSPRQI
jgi:hypothetical protein